MQDLGTDGPEPVDYPDVAASVAGRVARGEADARHRHRRRGHRVGDCGEQDRGIRAVDGHRPKQSRDTAREHNGANVLTLGATLVTPDEAQAIVTTWLTTPMREPRYIRRLAKIRDLEKARRWMQDAWTQMASSR